VVGGGGEENERDARPACVSVYRGME
jgi:hypothetical protein